MSRKANQISDMIRGRQIANNTEMSFAELRDVSQIIYPMGYLRWNSNGQMIEFDATIPLTSIQGLPASFFSGSYNDLTDKPVLFSGSYLDLTNKPTIPAAQVNSDWTSLTGVSVILNKPTLFSGAYADLTGKPALFSGAYVDLTGKPTIPAAQVNSDWNAVSGLAQILNKPSIPTLPKVAFFTTTTNASGVWTISITGFTTVSSVNVMAINIDNTAGGAKIGTLTSFSTTAATGTVVTANTILSLLGLLGLALGGAGISVRVRVEGT